MFSMLSNLARTERSSPHPSAAEEADRLVVNLEVVGGGAKGAGDDPLLARGDLLQGQPHVRRQFEPAAPAERGPFRLFETAARTTPPFGKPGDLLRGNHHNPSLPFHAKTKRPGSTRPFVLHMLLCGG